MITRAIKIARSIIRKAVLSSSESIQWVKPDLSSETGEYFENEQTKSWLSDHGVMFKDKKDMIEKLEKGRLEHVTERQIASIRNLSSFKEFEKEIKDPEYNEGFKNLEKRMQAEDTVKMEAPIVLNISGIYYGLSGNRRLNLARKYKAPIQLWIVPLQKKKASDLRPWSSIQAEYTEKYGENHHHLRLVCDVCGNHRTCRCSASKIEEHGICNECLSMRTASVRSDIWRADKSDKSSVFLGGQCDEGNAWRKKIKKEFRQDFSFIDPYDPDWDPEKNIYDELTGMMMTDYVVFYKGGKGSDKEKKFLAQFDKNYMDFDNLDELRKSLKTLINKKTAKYNKSSLYEMAYRIAKSYITK